MKIILVGATGTIGQAVYNELSKRHDVVKVGNSSGDAQVDISSVDSIKAMYESIGAFDALICATGNAHFGPFEKLTEDECHVGIKSKLMGQVNLILIGKDLISDNGSFTLTSGVLSNDPIPFGAAASLANGAIDSFVVAAAIEMTRGIRINAVSPSVVEESMEKIGDFFRGHVPVPASKVALAYSKSVEGKLTGKVIPAL
jgi:NAD(P)-dependent dehydrogenase (short-subunit alcohol dehydrogenase family)